jgi:cbb3-type cytochrome oxidase subunit 1
MPLLTRWMIKTSMLYLGLALFVGLLPPLARAVGWGSVPPGLTPVYVHLFMVGWVSLLIFGVVFWMFPKYSREKPRGSDKLGWAVFWLINAGLLFRVIGEGFALPREEGGWLLVLSAVLQWLAGLLFVVNTWGRVKEK